MPQYDSHPDDLERSRQARLVRQQLERQEAYLALLRQAARMAETNGVDGGTIKGLVQDGTSELNRLRERSGQRIFPRKRPKKQRATPPTCTVYLDECGSHSLKDVGGAAYPVFVLAAVIVRDEAIAGVEAAWRGWKQQWLGSDTYNIHEPDVRTRKGPFHDASPDLIAALASELAATAFHAVVCIIHRPDFVEEFGHAAADESLPQHPYLMALDFLCERLALILDQQFDGARAQVVAEARGPAEDALIQYEFARLHLDGTSYVGPSYFRQQFRPGIRFQTKSANVIGLQLADLLARPCGDKVVAPASTPPRWPELRDKLCRGQETKNSVLGFKVMPWRERYADLLTS